MLITLLIFALILGVIVVFHEFGHFFTAKRLGVRVDEFGLGFPPRLFGIKRGETTYTINLIPIGGFVKIHGEDGSNEQEPRSLSNRPAWQRILVLSAGVIMNIVLAAVLFSVGYGIGLPSVVDDATKAKSIKDITVQIVSINENTPASEAKIEPGDQIKALDQIPVSTIEEIENYNATRIGQTVSVTLMRQDKQLTVPITLRDLDGTGTGKMGVSLVRTGIAQYSIPMAIWLGIKSSIIYLWAIIVSFYTLIKNLFVGIPIGGDVAGPIGIAVLTGQVAKLGFIYLLQFTALLSLNLAVINFIPFPALDGGRALFVIIEKIRGKKINRDIETSIHNIGFTLLLILIALVTFRDLTKFGGSIIGFVKNIFT
jgi:regulator of sigma E protease